MSLIKLSLAGQELEEMGRTCEDKSGRVNRMNRGEMEAIFSYTDIF